MAKKSLTWAGAVGMLLLWSSLRVMGTEAPQGPAAVGPAESLRQGETGGADRPVVLANLAELRRQQGRFAEAVEAARQSLHDSPNGVAARQARIALCESRLAGKIPGPSEVEAPQAGQGETVQEPVKLQGSNPVATEQARRYMVNGSMNIEGFIDAEGCMVGLTLPKGLDPRVGREAIDTIQHWVFKPAEQAGKPVKTSFTWNFNYISK